MTSNNVMPTVPRNNTVLLKCGCGTVFTAPDNWTADRGCAKCQSFGEGESLRLFGATGPVEKPVVAAILNRFGPAGIVPEILSLVQWDGLNGCYYFVRNGVYTGIETDGHMHQ